MMKPITPSDMNFSSDLIGMPLPTPSMRKSTKPTLPIRSAMPKKCRISHKRPRPIVRRDELVDAAGDQEIRNSVYHCRSPFLNQSRSSFDEARVLGEPPRDDRERPEHERRDRETLRGRRHSRAVATSGSSNTLARVSSRLIIAHAINDSFVRNIQLRVSLREFAASSDKPENALIVNPTYIHGNSLRRLLTGMLGT